MSSSSIASPEPAPRAHWGKRIGLAAMTVSRLTLALGMLPYGVSKLCDFQFQVGASNYAQPLGEAPSTVLTWAFLGYSPVFQFLLGAFETIPAILLLFARTRRLGALLLFPVVLNVAMINYFFDLWPGTRLISAVLLALNTFLILYDFRMYLSFLSTLLVKPTPIANRKLRIVARIAGLVVPTTVIVAFLLSFHPQVARYLDPITDFIGHRQINRAGTWKIESLRIAGRPALSAAGASLYFDFTRRCVYENGVGREIGTFEASKSGHTFQIVGMLLAGAGGKIDGTYRVDGDRLVLNGFNGGQSVSLVLQRDRWGHDHQ
jgi:hypothetical protein